MNIAFLRVLKTFLILILIGGLTLTGCNSTNPASAEASGKADPEGTKAAGTSAPYKFTHFFNFTYVNDKFGETPVARELARITGVSVEVTKPETDDDQRLNVMMESGNLPDVITLAFNDENIGKLISSQQVYCINDLIDEYTPSIRQNMEPEYLQYHKYKDGKNYYFTNFIKTQFVTSQPEFIKEDDSTPVMQIRADVYEAIGKPDMNTPDSFFNALMEIKRKYPESLPYYCGYYDKDVDWFKFYTPQYNMFMLSQFGLTRYYVTGGKVQSVIRNPKFQDYIKFMNKLYINGLFDPSSFVDTSTVQQNKINNSELLVFSGLIWDGIKVTPKYELLPYFKDAVVKKASSGFTATLITKNASNPEKIMKFINFLETKEGKELASWGIEGKHWEWDSEHKPRLTAEYESLLKSNPQASDLEGVSSYWAFADAYYSLQIFNQNYKAEDVNKWKQLYSPQFSYDNFLGLMDPAGDSSEGAIHTRLRQLAKAYFPKMVMAGSESDCMAAFREFLKKCEEAGLSKLEDYWTQKYSEYNKK